MLPTSEQVLEWILKSGAAIVDLTKEHVEDLLDLMVFDGDVEKVLVNRLGPDGMPVAARKGGKANGKKAAKSSSSSSSKRKKGAESSSSDEDSDGSDTGGGTGKKGKGGKRAANGKARRKRAKLGSDTETESDDDQSSDFDSDAAAPSAAKKGKGKRRRAGKGSEDDDEEEEEASGDSDGGRKKKGSSKRRKKRVKRRVKAEGDSDQGVSSSESEDESSKRRKRGAAVEEADEAAEGGAGTDGGNTQYVYRMIRQYRPTVGWTDMPCGRCPVEEFCSEPPRRRAEAVRRPAQVSTGAPSTRIEFEGGIQGIGMLGGAGAAIGVSDAKWGELKGGIGNGVAPVNPVDCPAYKAWLDF